MSQRSIETDLLSCLTPTAILPLPSTPAAIFTDLLDGCEIFKQIEYNDSEDIITEKTIQETSF
jgi:hypothetical protein